MTWTERRHLAPVPRTDLNELAVDPIKQANWAKWTVFKRFWTEFASLPQHMNKQAMRGPRTELLLCYSQTNGCSMDWTEPEPKRAIPARSTRVRDWKSSWNEINEPNESIWPSCPKLNWPNFPDKLVTRELNCIELMTTILNFERQDLVSSRALLALPGAIGVLI